jgi:hypothetical protein
VQIELLGLSPHHVQPRVALEIFGLVRRLFTEGAADVLELIPVEVIVGKGQEPLLGDLLGQRPGWLGQHRQPFGN